MLRRTLLGSCLVLLSTALLVGPMAAQPADPAAAAASLLEADRDYARTVSEGWLPDSLAPMLADDVVMPAPPGNLVRGRDQVLEAIKANPANIGARLSWTPIRVGVSADGSQGFSYGYMSMKPAKGKIVPQKYLAYWVREDGAWKVAAYKRMRRPEGEVADQVQAPFLPGPALSDPAASQSVADREREFSDRAQQVGLGQAFAEFGHPDAINLGGINDSEVVVGNTAIGELVGAGTPTDSSPVSWSAEWSMAAGSGDLGITFGYIRPNQPAAGGKPAPALPFFTIWRREGADGAWLYVAE